MICTRHWNIACAFFSGLVSLLSGMVVVFLVLVVVVAVLAAAVHDKIGNMLCVSSFWSQLQFMH